MTAPRVSVVMSVHNGERYLVQAVESVLAQTFRDLEFVIVDDGSADATPAILEGYQRRDGRVVLRRQEHRGLIEALNHGWRLARGTFIARMDADDICRPERLSKQVQYVEAHADCVLLGTAAELIDTASRRVGLLTPPGDSETIGKRLRLGNVFVHGSILVPRVALEKVGGYDRAALLVEDYDLWCRLAALGRMANLTDPLY